jgi:hypothetical protein
MHDVYLRFGDDLWERAYGLNDLHPENWFGSVLYLGMGACYIPRIQSHNVTKTTIVEIDQRTIDHNQFRIKPEWVIVCEDAYKFEPTEQYDFIFVDIWYHATPINVIDELVDRYRRYLKDNGEIISLQTIRR